MASHEFQQPPPKTQGVFTKGLLRENDGHVELAWSTRIAIMPSFIQGEPLRSL